MATREDKRASNSIGCKTSASEDQATMATKYPPSRGPTCSWQQSIYQRGDKRDNDGEASARESNDGQASGKISATKSKRRHQDQTLQGKPLLRKNMMRTQAQEKLHHEPMTRQEPRAIFFTDAFRKGSEATTKF